MNICIVSGGRVPRKFYGGTERVVYWLVRELALMGHKVTMIAPEGSSHPGAAKVITYKAPDQNINQNSIDLEALVPEDVNVVHIHFAYSLSLSKPVLKTVHGYPFHHTGRKEYASPDEFDQATSFVSDSHRRVCGLPDNPFVYNGLDPQEYTFQKNKGDYLLFLGKVDWNVKGLSLAIKISQETGTRLVIAGDFLDPSYLERELKPQLSSNIIYTGQVGGVKKARLLAGAKALLFPTLWPEPFGLVSIEAMVSGTPVLGTKNGALPEVIVHGKTGFLASRPSETVEHLHMLKKIKPEDCRRHVLENFTSRIMAEKYLFLYSKICGQR